MSHAVQFFDSDDASLIANVGAYLREGLDAGDAVLIVATPEHNAALLSALARDGTGTRPLFSLDAEATLSRLLVDGEPNEQKFNETLGGITRSLRRVARSGRVRAYGEMVGLLWKSGRPASAVALEHAWNGLIDHEPIGLFCGYPIDCRAADIDTKMAAEIVHAHSHVVTADGSPVAAAAYAAALGAA